jgi:hypothetical protein
MSDQDGNIVPLGQHDEIRGTALATIGQPADSEASYTTFGNGNFRLLYPLHLRFLGHQSR